MNHLMQGLWMAEVSEGLLEVPSPSEDVSGWMWASKARLKQMVQRGVFFAYSYFNTRPE